MSPSPLSPPEQVVSCRVCRDEQYRTLWGEIETLTQAYSANSDSHRTLLEFVLKLISSSPSAQHVRKAASKTAGML